VGGLDRLDCIYTLYMIYKETILKASTVSCHRKESSGSGLLYKLAVTGRSLNSVVLIAD